MTYVKICSKFVVDRKIGSSDYARAFDITRMTHTGIEPMISP